MKVLFAVSNERDAEAITKVYQKEYKEIISSKIVYYYNAIIKELQKDKTYDRIVISEDIEMSVNDNYQAVDKMLFDKMDSISDEAVRADGEDIPIILLSNDRRTKNDPLLSKLFGLGLYNVLIGQDRSIQKVCQLMYRPRTKKEAKSYYHVESENVNYTANENDDGVSDSEIQNILNHYKKIGNNVSKVCQSFDSIVSQYSQEQVKMIIDVLPIDTKVILEENSDEYRKIMGITGKKARNTSELRKEKYVEKEVNSKTKLNKPVIIPAMMKSNKVVKVPNKVELEMEKKRAEKELLAKKKAEMERVEREKAAKRKEKERLLKEKAEKERIAREKAKVEAERKEREELERQKAELKAEKERMAREKAKAAEAKKKEQERIAREKAEAEAKRIEEERIAREKAEAEAKRKEEERIAREKAEAEKREKEELARQKAELEAAKAALAKEKAKIEAQKKAKKEAEKKEKERLEAEKAEAEKKAREELARQKAELEAEKAALAKEQAKLKAEAEKQAKKAVNEKSAKSKKETTVEAPKRGRGRPRKEPILIVEKEEVTKKRGRGRPRKEVKPEIDDDIDLEDININQTDDDNTDILASFDYKSDEEKNPDLGFVSVDDDDDDLDLTSLDDDNDDDIDVSELDDDNDDIDLSDLDDDDDIDLSDLDDDDDDLNLDDVEDDDIDLSDLDDDDDNVNLDDVDDDDIDLSDLDDDDDDNVSLDDVDDDDIDLSDLDDDDDDLNLDDVEDDDIDLSDLDDDDDNVSLDDVDDDDLDLSDLDDDDDNVSLDDVEDDDIDLSDLDDDDDNVSLDDVDDDDIDLSDLDDEDDLSLDDIDDDDIDLSDLDDEDDLSLDDVEDDDIDLSDLDDEDDTDLNDVEDDDIDLSDLDDEDDDVDLSDLDDEDDLDLNDVEDDDIDLSDLDDEDDIDLNDVEDDDIDLSDLDDEDDLDLNDVEDDDIDLSDLDEDDDLGTDDVEDNDLDLSDLDDEDDLGLEDAEEDDEFDIPEFDDEEENKETMNMEKDEENEDGFGIEEDDDLTEFDDDILNFDDDILEDDNSNSKDFNGIKNKNYKYDNNLAQSIKNIEEVEDVSDFNIDTDSLINSNQKMVAFVGTSKNGTSFVVNNLAETYANKGIKTAILDLTKNKNSYYIYTNDDDELRKKSFECFDKLRNGVAEGVTVNSYLDVYTSLPGEDEGLQDVKNIITTLLENYTVILLDCDFLTDARYFKVAQEIYLVQTYDILTIQPLTSFLRDLKVKGILDPNKLRIVINKSIKVNGINERNIIGGMSVYKDPGMTYMTDLFNKDIIRFTIIPFEEQIYAKYLEGVANCRISHKGYSKNFIVSMNKLSDMVYSKIDMKKSKKNYNDYMKNGQKEDKFSKDTKTILNKMKKNY